MKILWLANTVIPVIANNSNLRSTNLGGWLVYLSSLLSKEHDLVYVFPQNESKRTISGISNNIKYYGYYEKDSSELKYNKIHEQIFKEIVGIENPDIVHIWGTEFLHSLEMVRAVSNKEKIVISIQGIISICGKHYFSGLPAKVISSYTFRDIIKHDTIKLQKNKFLKRGYFEQELVRNCKYIIGRTEFDKACMYQINPDSVYFHCGEILREAFYDGKWDYCKCEKHSIFISQSGYPLKGFHFALEALSIVKKKYDDAKIYVAGGVLNNGATLIRRLKQKTYERYIYRLITELNLSDSVIFTGNLSSEQMKEFYTRANVFVLPSAIENSPNSLGEAMLIGTPCVAAGVGGVKDMMEDNTDGYIYQWDAPYMLANYILKVFDLNVEVMKISENARAHARSNHGPEKCFQEYIDAYQKIIEK